MIELPSLKTGLPKADLPSHVRPVPRNKIFAWPRPLLPDHTHFDRLLQLLTVGSQGVADEDIFYLHSFTVRLGYKLNLAELIASGTIDL